MMKLEKGDVLTTRLIIKALTDDPEKVIVELSDGSTIPFPTKNCILSRNNKQLVTGWTNVYAEGYSGFYETKEIADRFATNQRLACVELTGNYKLTETGKQLKTLQYEGMVGSSGFSAYFELRLIGNTASMADVIGKKAKIIIEYVD